MRYQRLRLRTSRPHSTRDLGLRSVEELNDETRSLPGAERLFAEVDDEYRQMEADYTTGLLSD